MHQSLNPYQSASFFTSLKQKITQQSTIKIAILDVDFTLTSGENAAIFQTRDLIDKAYDLTVFITGRTEEMLIDSHFYKNTAPLKFTRPSPHLIKQDEIFTYEPPEQVLSSGLLNPDIIASSSGSRILVKQSNHTYEYDNSYEQGYPTNWRIQTLRVLEFIKQQQAKFTLAPIEYPDNYQQGKTDVYPAEYRIQVNFKTLKRLKQFNEEYKQLNTQLFYPTNDSDPSTKTYTLHLTPRPNPKADAVNHLISRLTSELEISHHQVHIFMAGDSLTDLYMGLHAPSHVPLTLLLVGESRLTPYLTKNYYTTFAGINLKQYIKLFKQDTHKKLIIGDLSYPGTKGPVTIIAYLLRNNLT